MFKASFLPNQSVEDADINAIGENIAEAEYPVFMNGEPYGVDALNGITAQMVTAGVKRGAGDNCAVSLSGTTAFIKSGVAFFDSGVAMTIDDNGTSVEREDSTQVNYVFLFYDPALNVAGARCAVSIPIGVEYVLLATISASGVITQNVKKFCKSKVLDTPNTPLVIYNSIAGDNSNDVEETILIADLEQYTLMRISCPEGYKGNTSGIEHKWLVDISNAEDVRGVFCQIYPKKTLAYGVQGGTIHLKYYFDTSHDYCPASGVDITLDFEENAIVIAIERGNSAWEVNNIKIELFAGEVQ